MNLSIVYRLILKDWYLLRLSIVIALASGLLGLSVVAIGGSAGFILGAIALVTIIIAFGANNAVANMVNERKEQTLPFVMSLPISYREYTASKILGHLILFLIPWLFITLGSLAMLWISPDHKQGMIPYVAIMATEMLVATCLIAAVALITESQPWTVACIMVGNVAFNLVGYIVAHIPSIARTLFGPTLQWNATSVGLLLAEFASAALMLSLTFVFQARKKDFL
jgi:ABC-type transport system involved in multi-copper enzyme maturation permease subunit